MKKLLLILLMGFCTIASHAQRSTDRLDRGLVAMKVSGGVFLSWRITGEEYYDTEYNVYRDGEKLNDEPLSVSNYTDKSGTTASSYSVTAVVRGKEQQPCAAVSPWGTSYKEIKLTHEGIKSTLIPNDACCADVDGDGELEILMKFDNLSEMNASYPRNGYQGEYSIFECLKLDGTRLWWVNCGPNMGDFQNNEQNIVGYDWDQDGRAEVVMRAADGTVIHMADGTTYTVGDASKNVRGATGGGVNWFVNTDGEYLVYMDGITGKPYQCIPYPLKRLESGESDLNSAWGDGYGHRCSKFFFGAPYLDGRKPSIFLARGIYTRHKMIAYDVDPDTHKLKERWRWYNNSNGPWKGQGYHNYAVADVDMDGRDEIVYGSMVIDDNGKGLSTTGLGHGDAEHVGDLNPYVHGLEIYACMEDNPGNNYRDATTSKIYHRYMAGNDDGRAMAGNFTNNFPGGLGCSAREGAISTVTGSAVSGLEATGVNTNFRIYWDGDLCEETFNYVNGKNTEGCIAKYGSWSPIYTCAGSMTNNDTKGTPCYQGDILGDWREEIIMRTAGNNIRIYSTPTATKWRNYTLWHDHQYRNAMVWQMCGYNQPPHASYFLGELEGITVAPPPLTNNDREEVKNGGSIGASLNGKHVLVSETGNSSVSIDNGAQPYILTFNVPTWVQGTAPSECTTKDMKINYTTYTCTVTGGGIGGEARLVKQGDGILSLPKADFTHTGETNIWEGTLSFDGTMRQSPLWLNRFTTLNSDGGEFLSIKADYGSVIRPGGADKQGSITTGDLTLGFGSRLVIDLFGNGQKADVVNAKNLTIEKKTGSAWEKAGPEYLSPIIEFVGHLADGEKTLTPGKYVIANIENVDGSIDDLVIEGIATVKKKLYMEDGKLVVEVFDMRDPATVTWSGEQGGTWDNAETDNFLIGGDNESTSFVSGDDVVFDDNAVTKTVNIAEDVYPASVTVNNTQSYTFNGPGAIAGNAKFFKEGTGTVIMKGVNSYTGGNYLKGGITRVSQLSNQYAETGNLGGITKTASLFTMENGAVLQTTAAVETASPMKMVGDEGGVINAGADFRMNAALSGTVLTKKGTGCLFMMGSNTLSRLVLAGGSVAEQKGNPATTVEMQAGTLYDDAQATSHAIEVPEGKSATWQLTYTYYTAYANKLTGKGTLTIIPRNTVQRVRITGNWSEFEGTVKHTTKDICFPFDASTGMPKGTLYVGDGCTVSNVCKAFTIGMLTGKGSLIQPIADFKSQSAVSGNNTWNIGNSDMGDFTFDGTFADAGGSNKCLFNKVGTCKMTVSGASTHTGATNVKEGELNLKSGAQLGTGTLTVAEGAVLSGTTTAKVPLINKTVNINGTLQAGAAQTSTTGVLFFDNSNVTISKTGVYKVGASRCATKTSAGCTSISGINRLTVNGTIQVTLSSSHSLEAGDSIRVFEAQSFAGTPVFDLPEIGNGLEWDTSRISEGLLFVAVGTGIQDILADMRNEGCDIYNAGGQLVRKNAHSLNGLPRGIYFVRGRKIVVK
ncbi:MAG: autotransporter-associated beta strand repeat-containing protein [Prevotella sp.]|nr:autotransporter-associated beta strand repeat-containing protein [Prevotella sp.]